MHRITSFALLAALAGTFPAHAQSKNPPRQIVNTVGMKFVWIPPGDFQMGSTNKEKGRGDGQERAEGTGHLGLQFGRV